MIRSSIETISEFQQILQNLPVKIFTTPCNALSNATLGQHTRHIIELFQCLLNGYEESEVCYDKRKRDYQIETDIPFAIACLDVIATKLERENKALTVEYVLNNSIIKLDSNYFREVMYNLEHTIHHQALIRVAVESLSDYTLPLSFGVAASTLQYRAICAQ